jgi:beta-glucosidase-like glycosyl hydrolase
MHRDPAMQIGRLLFPALRWEPATGFDHEADTIDAALRLGVGGFIIFGGTAPAVRALTADLTRRSAMPLLIGADLERGAGQQFEGATPLPPLAAIGALDDDGATRAAAALTAREARALGVNWIYAPVADIDLEPDNPIVGTRAFGTTPELVATHVAAWIEACRMEGVLCCAKHFPGHGRTTEDSHAALPRVDVAAHELEIDLLPFRAAVTAGVDSIMTAHVVYTALDRELPATLSGRVIDGILRTELGYDGIVVTDALIMEGVLEGVGDEGDAAVAAVAAGCDALLYPADAQRVAHAVESAIGDRIPEARVQQALARIDAAAARVASVGAGVERPAGTRLAAHVPARLRRTRTADGELPVGRPEDRIWARALGARTIRELRGHVVLPLSFDLCTVDDDVGSPYDLPRRDVFANHLRGAGYDVHNTLQPHADGRSLAVAVFADVRAWKGRARLSPGAVRRVEEVVAECPRAKILLFGHPRLVDELPGSDIVCAWGGEAIMQEALADWVAARGER